MPRRARKTEFVMAPTAVTITGPSTDPSAKKQVMLFDKTHPFALNAEASFRIRSNDLPNDFHGYKTGMSFDTAEVYLRFAQATLDGRDKVATSIKDLRTLVKVQAKLAKLNKEPGKYDDDLNDFWDSDSGWEDFLEGEFGLAKALEFKFRQGKLPIRELLLSTGEAELVYAVADDKFLGIGFAVGDVPASRADWGQNKLGKALMVIRKGLVDNPVVVREKVIADSVVW